MDFERDGIRVQVAAADLPDDTLREIAAEVAGEAGERGLELGVPAFAGGTAVEATTETAVDPINAKEVLTGQLGNSYQGYQSEVEQINKNRNEAEKVEAGDEETMKTEFEAWFSEDRQKHVTEAMEADSELEFTLIAVPNETVTVDEVLEDARDFGKGQPYATDVYPAEVIPQYSAEEVSGTDPKSGNKFKFVLVPNKLAPELLYAKVNVQKQTLKQQKENVPFLEAPTPLTAMTFLRTRRAMDDALVGKGTADKTHMRCYDMKDKPISGFVSRYVPYLLVRGNGRLVVGCSNVKDDDVGFALVG